MPGRLTEIFDRAATPVEDRCNRIVGCCYSNEALEAAEKFAIFKSSLPVDDQEGLARILECPNSVTTTGSYHAMAFQEAMKRGLSTQRVNLTNPERIHEFGRWKADAFNKRNEKRQPRTYLGYVVGLCAEVRKIRNSEGNRFFGVFATPENDAAHADIFLVLPVDEGDKLHIQRLFHKVFKVANMVGVPA